MSQPKGTKAPRAGMIYLIILAVWVLIFAHDLFVYRKNVEIIPYSQFLTYLQQKQVADASVYTDRVTGKLKKAPQGHTQEFTTVRVQDPQLADRLTAAGVQFTGVKEGGLWGTFFTWFLVGIFFVMMARLMGRGGMGGLSRGGPLALGRSRAKIYAEKGLKTRFEDVAGVDEAKEELSEIVQFLKNPSHYTKLGGRMPKGLLLIGPPGTGKTLMARAVAGEAGVPFFSINGSEFVELFVGLGAARVRDLFEQARAQAPCIVFIDELDALGKARGISAITGSANDEKEQTLNQLLAEMDGFDPSRGIVLLGATNRPEVLDPALMRAGRFDRQVLIDKPDRLGRAKILEVHLKGIVRGSSVSPEVIAGMTAGFSGADLANLVNEAALIATRRGGQAVEMPDFTQAIERLVAGLERKNRILQPDEKRRVAYHEMGHALVALSLGKHEAVHKVSVIPRGLGALGYTMRRPTEDRYLMSVSQLEEQLSILLGGRASELVFFPEISTGAADDLDKATEIARAMVTRYGMSGELGLATFEKSATPLLGENLAVRGHDYSEETARRIDEEVRKLLGRGLERSIGLVRDYRPFVEECVGIL
ncbi:MAG: ATP-dependent zinc metalloprotease FtsH, partial [Bdellovibrionota bacterium]